MNKKGIILLSSILCLASVGAVALTSMSNSELLYADSPKTEAQYTISNWELIDQTGSLYHNFGENDGYYAGFFFRPKTGRTDVVLGLLIQSYSQGEPIEELQYSEEDGSLIYQSPREWYMDDDTHYHYENYDKFGNFRFEVSKMLYVICTKTDEGYDLDTKPSNFSESMVAVYSELEYNYMDTPGATASDFYNWHEFKRKQTRVFTPSMPYDNNCSEPGSVPYGNSVCAGFKIDPSTISLTYSCSY